MTTLQFRALGRWSCPATVVERYLLAFEGAGSVSIVKLESTGNFILPSV